MYPTGVAGTSALGSVGLITVNVIAVTQSAMTSALGSITAVGHANIALTALYLIIRAADVSYKNIHGY